jgi:hypothetical protein
VFFFVLQGVFLSAQDDATARIQSIPQDSWTWAIIGLPEPPPPKKPILPFQNRTFEISTQVGIYASNVFAGGDFFQRPFRILGNMIGAGGFSDFIGDPSLYYLDNASVEIEDILKGFRTNFGGKIAPLSININIKDRWGFGFDVGHTDFTGNMFLPEVILDIPKIMLDPTKATGGTFDVGAAVFMDFAIPIFFPRGGL